MAMDASESRGLTERERDVLVTMIEHGVPSLGGTADETFRASLRAQVEGLRVWGGCGCEHCPSIDLGDASGPNAMNEGPRVILDGTRGTEGLLLFVDSGKLSYLEQYSVTDDVFDEFVPAGEIDFP